MRRCTLSRLALLGLSAWVASCVPSFPSSELLPADAGEAGPSDAGDAHDGGAAVDGGADLGMQRVCERHPDCPGVSYCTAAGQCTNECAGHGTCPRAGSYCLLGRCVPYCDDDTSCPAGLDCTLLRDGVRMCLCQEAEDCRRGGHCPGGAERCDETFCVEGRCVLSCLEEDGPRCDEPGRTCPAEWGAYRCMPVFDCAPGLDEEHCGGPLHERFCLGGGDSPDSRSACTRYCSVDLDAGGDGDDCGLGFRCLSLPLLSGSGSFDYCSPVGTLPYGARCLASLECLSGFCVEERCTELCTPGMRGSNFCRQLTGDARVHCVELDLPVPDSFAPLAVCLPR